MLAVLAGSAMCQNELITIMPSAQCTPDHFVSFPTIRHNYFVRSTALRAE